MWKSGNIENEIQCLTTHSSWLMADENKMVGLLSSKWLESLNNNRMEIKL